MEASFLASPPPKEELKSASENKTFESYNNNNLINEEII
jgi:hypothetical protein